MKNKCTSKRQFKKILNKMLLQYPSNLKEAHFYAANNFNCGIKTYKNQDITFSNSNDTFCMKPNTIILTMKVYVQKNNSDKQDT